VPTYQYACTACDHTFEQFQSFSDDALTVCPECQGRLRKVFNAVGVVFKGSGFYRTDSRSDVKATSGAKDSSGGANGSPAAPAESSSGTTSSSETSTPAKPASKKTSSSSAA
jgi:putative FmdB family regulatory protein